MRHLRLEMHLQHDSWSKIREKNFSSGDANPGDAASPYGDVMEIRHLLRRCGISLWRCISSIIPRLKFGKKIFDLWHCWISRISMHISSIPNFRDMWHCCIPPLQKYISSYENYRTMSVSSCRFWSVLNALSESILSFCQIQNMDFKISWNWFGIGRKKLKNASFDQFQTNSETFISHFMNFDYRFG